MNKNNQKSVKKGVSFGHPLVIRRDKNDNEEDSEENKRKDRNEWRKMKGFRVLFWKRCLDNCIYEGQEITCFKTYLKGNTLVTYECKCVKKEKYVGVD